MGSAYLVHQEFLLQITRVLDIYRESHYLSLTHGNCVVIELSVFTTSVRLLRKGLCDTARVRGTGLVTGEHMCTNVCTRGRAVRERLQLCAAWYRHTGYLPVEVLK